MAGCASQPPIEIYTGRDTGRTISVPPVPHTTTNSMDGKLQPVLPGAVPVPSEGEYKSQPPAPAASAPARKGANPANK
jgi:hypothetical protein